jgi:energy-coupling factor transporter ATP-binding protein EcfA2
LLPAAPALTSGIPIGTATLGAHSEAVCLPHAAYRANVAVIGTTGAGKSTFLQHLAHDAITREGVQLVVIDPDSDLVAAMVGRLPDEEKLRAVVVSFGHPERAIGVNLLDASTGCRHDQIVSSIVEAWKRFYDEAWGPRLEDLIRAACTTILKANQARPRDRQLTLLDIKPLLQISSFRRQVVAEADDIRLTTYWRDDYMGMPRTERLTAIKPVLTRINRFLQHDAAHAIVGQSASTIDLPRLLESGAPLFIDAAAQTIGKETAALLDAVLINIINDAVCERRSHARQVLIIVGEFQHAPGLWDEYLPRIRKRRGSYVLTSQGLATIDAVRPDLHKVLIGNTGTQVIFRTLDPEEATYLAGVLDNTVTPEDLQTLKLRQCYIKTSDETGPLPVVSATLPPPPPSSSGTTRLIAEACARRYGRPISEVMAARNRWMTELFFAPNDERGHNLVRADDGDVPVGGRSAATTEHSPATALGSQPMLGLPVTRARPSERTTARPSARPSASPVPSPPPSPVLSTVLTMDVDGADPLPLVTTDQRQRPQGRGTARRRRARRRAADVLPLPATTVPSEAASDVEGE